MTVVDRLNGVNSALAIKAPVRVATTANITLSGLQTIDGVTVVAGDRVLVKNQNTGSENGIYDAASTAWTRSKDFDGPRDVVQYTRVIVGAGTTYTGYEFQLTTANPITLGSTSLTFTGAAALALSVAAKDAALAAQAAAEAAQTAAETAETNAETAETNAETAQAAAEAAQAAAELAETNAANSAAAAAVDGGELAALEASERQTILNEAGYAPVDIPPNVMEALPYQDSVAFWTSVEDTGTLIHRESTVDAGGYSMTSPYTPFCHTWLWVRQVENGASIEGNISWDRKKSPEEAGTRVVIDATNGLVIQSSVGTSYNLIIPTTGHSDSQGSPDATEITTAAIDTGNALMLQGSGTTSPYVGTQSLTGIVDLVHGTGAVGETPLAGAAEAWLTKIDEFGAKIPTIMNSTGFGSAAIHDLMSSDRIGYWPVFERVIQRAMYWTREAGKLPMFGPMLLFQFEAANSGPYGDIKPTAAYLAHLQQMHKRYNDFLRAVGGFHSDAPPLPIIGPQSTEEDSAMWSGGSKVFSLDYDGTRQAHFLTLLRPYGFTGFICCGPTYAFPQHSDNQHLTSTGNYLSGHQAGRYLAEYALRKPLKPIYPYQLTRNSTTQFTIKFALPSGQSLAAFDTVTVADALDGFKGFVTWRADTAAQVTITSVAVSGTDSVVVQHSAVSASVQMWCDYARWADDVTYQVGRNRTYGPRGNLRGDTAHSTTSGGSYYDWCVAFRVPVPINTSTWDVEKAMARYI